MTQLPGGLASLSLYDEEPEDRQLGDLPQAGSPWPVYCRQSRPRVVWEYDPFYIFR